MNLSMASHCASWLCFCGFDRFSLGSLCIGLSPREALFPSSTQTPPRRALSRKVRLESLLWSLFSSLVLSVFFDSFFSGGKSDRILSTIVFSFCYLIEHHLYQKQLKVVFM